MVINRIVTSDRFKHIDKSFKYFIGYADGDVVRPLCIILLLINGFIKYFNNGYKNMPFMIKDDSVLLKCSEIWDKIKELLGIKLHSESIYDDEYIKTKVRLFNGEIHATFWGDKIPNEDTNYTIIAVIIIASIMKMVKKYFPQVYLEECKYCAKEKKVTRFIDAELELSDFVSSNSE